MLFQSTVLSVLLYGSSSWAVIRRDITRLVTFTEQCQRFMLRIDKFKQQLERITSNDIRHKLGNLETAEDSLMAQRLRWLGHLERIEDHRLPKQLLHAWLPSARPAHRVRLRRKDRILKDLKMVGLTSTWSQLTQDRQKWKNVCASKINSIITSRVELENAQSSQKACDRADPSRCQDQQPLLCTVPASDCLSHKQGKKSQLQQWTKLPRSREPAKAGIKCDRCGRLFTQESDKKRHKSHQRV